MQNSTRDLLNRWQANCKRSQIANYDAANNFSQRNYALGIPTIALSAIVGTAVFGTLQEEAVAPWLRLCVGGLSVIAAVLSALQTFLKWGELSAKFRVAGAEYGVIKRQIDQILAAATDPDEKTISAIREKMDTISRDAPELPREIWAKARAAIPTALAQEKAKSSKV